MLAGGDKCHERRTMQSSMREAENARMKETGEI